MYGETEPDKNGTRIELENIRARKRTLLYRVERLLVRLLRLGGGVVIGILIYVGYGKLNIADVPLAELTLGRLIDAFFCGLLMLGFGYVGFQIAFGPPPTEGEDLSNARKAWQINRQERAARLAEETRIAELYKRGRLYGLLRDPNFGFEHPVTRGLAQVLVPILAVLIPFGLVGLFIWWLTR